MGFGYGPPTIVTDGLVFAVDAGNPKSFTPDTLPVSDLVNYISNKHVKNEYFEVRNPNIHN